MTLTLIRPGLLYAWYGPSLFIVGMDGVAGSDELLSGYYFREARYLRTCRLELDGEAPWLCESAAVAPSTLEFAYTYPEVAEYGGGGSGQAGDSEPTNARGIPQRAIDIRLRYQVGLDELRISAVLGNRARQPHEFEVTWEFDADFADIQEAQGGKRQQTASV